MLVLLACVAFVASSPWSRGDWLLLAFPASSSDLQSFVTVCVFLASLVSSVFFFVSLCFQRVLPSLNLSVLLSLLVQEWGSLGNSTCRFALQACLDPSCIL